MNVTIKQLRAFVTVAHELSFTRASEKLYVTQSALTSSLKAFEAEIGVRLLDRSTRSIALTAEGRSFLPVADRLLRELHESLDQLRMSANRQRGSVIVAATPSFINYVLAPAVAQTASNYPGINVRLIEANTKEVNRLILTEEADFGITTLFEEAPALDKMLLLVDNYGAVFSKSHSLHLENEPLPWITLVRHTLIGLERSNGIRMLVDLHPGVPPKCKIPAYEVGSMSSLQSLLTQGFGFATLPALAAMPLVAEGLCFKCLERPNLRRQLFVVKKKSRSLSTSAQALLESMTDSLEQLESDLNIKVLFSKGKILEFL